jgi:hypothetical protein
MRRRDFIKVIGGTVVSVGLVVHAREAADGANFGPWRTLSLGVQKNSGE